MGFSTTEVNKLTFKVQAGGVIDADSGARWYESKLAFSPKVLPERILTDYNLIPAAGDLATAQSNAAADPTNIRDLSAAGDAVQLSRVTAGADNTWIAYNTLNDPSSGVAQNWIQPPSIPLSSGAPSIGYSVRLYSGDPTGVQGVDYEEILTTAEQANPGYVGWVFNYDMGLLFIANDLASAIGNNTGGNYPGGFDLYVTGFRYVGATGGGGGQSIEIEGQGVSVTTDVSKINFTGTGVTTTGSGTGNEDVTVTITAGSGPQGVQGAQGIQGTTGAQGSQGTIGLQGTTGVQGIQGTTGLQGIQGTIGLQGTTGVQGIQGTTGLQGIQGTTGLQGTTGAQGIQGTTGLQGIQGTTGLQGTTGAQGIQGIQGVQGVQGTTGLQGTTGAQGVQGTTGLQGIQGTQGITGLQGTQGIQGVTGLQGTQGVQGVQGVQGTAGAANIQAGEGVRIDSLTGGIDEINVNIDPASNLYFNSANELSVTSTGGSDLEIANSTGDGTANYQALSGTFTKINFVDSNNNGELFAMASSTVSGQVNVFHPAPPAPTYPNYFNRNVASGATSATVAENNTPTSLRIAIPNATLTGTSGGNYEDSGWSGSNTTRSVYRQSSQGTITFGTGNTSSPVKVRGFSGPEGAGDSEIEVIVYDADGTTPLDSHTITNITANGTYTSTSGNIIITIAGYNTIINPYDSQDVYEASIKVDVIMGVPSGSPGTGTGIFNNTLAGGVKRDGGKFTVSMSMTADTNTTSVDPPSPDLPTSYSYTVFADANPNSPNLTGAVVADPTVDTASYRYISGIKYYTNGTTLSTSIDGINFLNGNSIISSNINVQLEEWSLSTLSINDTSYNLSQGTITVNSGDVNDWDQTDIDYDTNASVFTIANSNYRFRWTGGDAKVRVRDPWSGYTSFVNSGTRKLLIDVGQTNSSSTIEYFNRENQRLFRDTAGTTYTSWDSTKSLLDVTQPPNSRSSIDVENLCWVGGNGLPGSEFFADIGNNQQLGTIISSDLSNYEPSGNPNYNTMALTPVFHRLFPTSCVDFNLIFTGNSGISSNFVDALTNNQMKIYVFPVGANPNPALGIDPNTGTNYTYLPTYLDGNNATRPANNDQYALSLHGGNTSGAWSAGGWIPSVGSTPGAYTGLDTIETRMMKATSSGNTGQFTFGASSNVAVGGFYVEVQLIDRTIRLDQIQYVFVS